jgi:glyoxylase-like metal-dependent hydrolase (beta-lactamase superfamily II)
MRFTLSLAAVACCCLGLTSGRATTSSEKEIRLYAIDCGSLTFKDMSMFSDTGHYDGKKNGSMVDPCFLLQHPAGFFLWDTGLGDALVGHDPPVNEDGVGLHVQKTLVGQLAQIGVRPADIKVLAFSHFHVDHTGNANLFTAATWLINEEELRWALGKPTPPVVVPESFNAYKNVQTRIVSGDYDVFGDGTIRILRTPGHTPGHQVLLVKLAHTGPVLLSGDLYHLASDRPLAGDSAGQVMTINADRAQTLASMNRVESILKNTASRLVIQHDPADFASLPKFPAFLN